MFVLGAVRPTCLIAHTPNIDGKEPVERGGKGGRGMCVRSSYVREHCSLQKQKKKKKKTEKGGFEKGPTAAEKTALRTKHRRHIKVGQKESFLGKA